MRRHYVYAPVYETEGREWVCTTQAHLFPDEARKIVQQFAERFPEWAKVNVLQRIARFELVELKEPR